MVQQKLLESVSPYFTRCLKADTFKEGEQGRLYCPDDNVGAWRVLLYWIMHRKQPDDLLVKSDLVAVRCWVLGDKYDIPRFQDEAMFALLAIYSERRPRKGTIGEAVVSSAPSSKLRKLMAEEVVFMLFTKLGSTISPTFDGIGFLGELMEMCACWAFKEAALSNRPKRRAKQNAKIWKEFMVCEWPHGHDLLS